MASAGRQGEGDFRLSDSPSHLLRRAQQYASDIFAKAGISDAVTLRQTVLLAAISEQEGQSQSELVRATGVDRSTLADMMARMERKGLIARSSAASDGRAKAVKLTAAGRSRLAGALPAMRRVDEALVASLPRVKRKAFVETLGELAEAAAAEEEREIADAKAAKKKVKAQKKMAKAKAKKKDRKAKRKKR